MFKVQVKDSVIKHCEELVSNYNFGQRKEANGTKEQQLTGVIGQSVIMDLFEEGYVDGETGFDGGVDILFNNKKIDVKTMGRKTDARINYTNNFLKLQDYFDTELYIFCSYHKIKKELTVCGWIDKQTFIDKRTFYPKGTVRTRFDKSTFKTFSDLYEIDNSQLTRPNSFQELKQQLLQLR